MSLNSRIALQQGTTSCALSRISLEEDTRHTTAACPYRQLPRAGDVLAPSGLQGHLKHMGAIALDRGKRATWSSGPVSSGTIAEPRLSRAKRGPEGMRWRRAGREG